MALAMCLPRRLTIMEKRGQPKWLQEIAQPETRGPHLSVARMTWIPCRGAFFQLVGGALNQLFES